jgi:hypothetical protein
VPRALNANALAWSKPVWGAARMDVPLVLL